LVAIPGVGKKTAERLVVELREKVGATTNGQGIPGEHVPVSAEAISALVNLGYRQAEAEKIVRGAVQRGATTIAEVIRESLRSLRT
jgi:Holliday junction DNA helicase RuvA